MQLRLGKKMELVYEKEVEMPLLERKRVTFKLVFEGATPKMEDVKKLVASKMKLAEDSVEVRHIFQKFGEHQAKVIAHLYKSAEMLKKYEPKKKEKKAAAAQ